MTKSWKIQLIVVLALVAALVGWVFIPIHFYKWQLPSYINKPETELLKQFGRPALVVTLDDVKSNPDDWPWWGESYSPKPLVLISHKAYGYSVRSFVIFWVYISEQGEVEHVQMVST